MANQNHDEKGRFSPAQSAAAKRLRGDPSSAPGFAQMRAAKDALDKEVTDASVALKGFPRGPTGMTPDSVKSSPEYRAAKQRYDNAFAKLRSVNGVMIKTFGRTR